MGQRISNQYQICIRVCPQLANVPRMSSSLAARKLLASCARAFYFHVLLPRRPRARYAQYTCGALAALASGLFSRYIDRGILGLLPGLTKIINTSADNRLYFALYRILLCFMWRYFLPRMQKHKAEIDHFGCTSCIVLFNFNFRLIIIVIVTFLYVFT
jgi:hypothetical protein